MHMLHLTAFISAPASCPPAPVPARSEPGHASAFKAPRAAGRRGRESTARQSCNSNYITQADSAKSRQNNHHLQLYSLQAALFVRIVVLMKEG